MKYQTGDIVGKLQGETLILRPEKTTSRRFQWTSERHCHAEYELHLILQGEAILDVEQQNLRMKPGNGVLLKPGTYHHSCTQPGQFERMSLSVALKEGKLQSTLSETEGGFLPFSFGRELSELCCRFFREHEERSPFYKEMRQMLLLQILIGALRQLQLPEDVQKSTDEAENRRIDTIDQYFEDHYMDNGGVGVLAESLHLSRRQLSRVLQKHYAMSFQEKITAARMDRAAVLLRTTAMSSTEIASAIGYNAETAFYQAFRKHFSMTPQKYRKLQKK